MSTPHFILAPLLIPLFAALLQLLPWGESPQRYRRIIGIVASIATLIASVILLFAIIEAPQAYAIGSWQAPFGIVLVADKFALMMICLTSVLALPVLVYASHGEDNLGSHFQCLFQFQLLGINGAFLTGDLFNLFVFFEILLISSYALLMHGGGKLKLRATLHYVLLNLAGSALFLISLGILYGTTGTLNMADMAQKVAQLTGDEAHLARAGGMMLLLVFGLKAAMLPVYFWLPQAYAFTTGTVAALFAIMTKVGIYSIIRVFTLIFGADAGEASLLGYQWLWWLGLSTLFVGAVGVMAARDLRLLVAYLVVVSVGTMLTTFAIGNERAISAVMYYMLHSTLITGALFLLADVVAAQRGKTASRIVSGRKMAQHGLLAVLFFTAAIAIIGMPPFSGFIGKLHILEAARVGEQAGWLWPAILLSTLSILIAMSRVGSKMFWHTLEGKAGEVKSQSWQLGSVVILLGTTIALTIFAQPISQFGDEISAELVTPNSYIQAVLGGAAL